MNSTFELVNGTNISSITPLNSDEITIQYKKLDIPGCVNFIPELSTIILFKSDYTWILSQFDADKSAVIQLNYYCDGVLKHSFTFNYFLCSFDLDRCVVEIVTRHKSNIYNALNYLDVEFDFSIFPAHIVQVDGLSIEYPRSFMVQEMLDYFITIVAGMSWDSEFLLSSTPPIQIPVGTVPTAPTFGMTTNNYYRFLFISLAPAGDVITELKIRFGDLLSQLCNEYLNLGWYYDEINNKMIIEHISYFDNGFTYSGSPVVGIDATAINGGKWLLDTNNYKINESKIVLREMWTPNTVNYNSVFSFDWGFIYPNNSISTTTNNIRLTYETNIKSIEDRIYVEGGSALVLMACYFYPLDGKYHTFQHLLSGNLINNVAFWQCFIYKWWRWNRVFKRLGDIDYLIGVSPTNETIYSTVKLRQQLITIPNCCDTIDPYKLVKTGLGDAYIEDYSINTATGMVTLNLKYEDQ